MLLWGIGVITAGLTAFYMSRMMFLTFWGEPRWDDGVHPHESPATMTVALAALGGLALVGGLVNTPFQLTFEHFLEPSFEGVELAHLPAGGTQAVLAAISVLAGLVGIALAYRRYVRAAQPAEEGGMWDTLLAGYRVDDLYGKTLVLPGKRLANVAAFSADAKVVNGAVNGVGAAVKLLAEKLRPIQTGLVRNYGVGILVGVVGLVLFILATGGGL